MKRPQSSEHPEYYNHYIALVKGDNILKVLDDQIFEMQEFLSSLPEGKENFSYSPGKWTVKEVIGHVIDTERIMGYRALSIARGETKSLPGFEQDDYVKNTDFNKRSLYDLAHEFGLVRESNIALFKHMDETALSRMGNANNKHVSVRAIVFMMAGHAQHHVNVIKEKYL